MPCDGCRKTCAKHASLPTSRLIPTGIPHDNYIPYDKTPMICAVFKGLCCRGFCRRKGMICRTATYRPAAAAAAAAAGSEALMQSVALLITVLAV